MSTDASARTGGNAITAATMGAVKSAARSA